MAEQSKPKPYRNVGGSDQAPNGFDYKDLVKKRANSLATLDTAAATAVTVVYSSYSFPLTTLGDLLGHDGTGIVRKAVGTDGQALCADSGSSDGLTWRSFTTTKGDLLGYDTAPNRVPVGTNDQVLMADSAQALGLKWASLTTTKGDLLGHNGSDPVRIPVGTNGRVLTALSSDAEGVEWAFASSFPGDIIFCTGSDGDLTLVADTTLSNSAGSIVAFYYGNITLSTFSLTQHSSDHTVAIHISGTLSSDGGSISLTPTETGVAGGAGAGGGGAGGRGGDRGYWLKVYAKIATGSGTIYADGGAGSNGGNATAATATANGASGTTGANDPIFFGTGLSTTGSSTVGGGGGSSGTGGTAGAGTGIVTDNDADQLKTPEKLFLNLEYFASVTSGYGRCLPGEMDGSGAGGRNTGAQGGGGGGSGGGSTSYHSQAVAGSAGGAGLAGAPGAGGGAGGPGGGGSILVVVIRYLTGTWTFRAAGGAGGNGGNGFGNGGGGAGGPGGGGGWVKAAVGYGSDTPTVTAPGGIGGAVGAGSGGAADGTIGNDGNAGRTEFYVL